MEGRATRRRHLPVDDPGGAELRHRADPVSHLTEPRGTGYNPTRYGTVWIAKLTSRPAATCVALVRPVTCTGPVMLAWLPMPCGSTVKLRYFRSRPYGVEGRCRSGVAGLTPARHPRALAGFPPPHRSPGNPAKINI